MQGGDKVHVPKGAGPTGRGGGGFLLLDANYPPQLTVGQRPLWGGRRGGAWDGGFWEGWVGCLEGFAWGGGGSSPCPPSSDTITLNVTLI